MVIIFKSLLTTFEVRKFFEVAGAVTKICLSLKPNLLNLFKSLTLAVSNLVFTFPFHVAKLENLLYSTVKLNIERHLICVNELRNS